MKHASHVITTALGFAGGILVEVERPPATTVAWQIAYGGNVRYVEVPLERIGALSGTYSHGGPEHFEFIVDGAYAPIDLPHEWPGESISAAWEAIRQDRPDGRVWLPDYIVTHGGAK